MYRNDKVIRRYSEPFKLKILDEITTGKLNKQMKKIYFMYFIIFATIVLLIYNISELDFNDLQINSFNKILPNLLLIISMLITIREIKKINNIHIFMEDYGQLNNKIDYFTYKNIIYYGQKEKNNKIILELAGNWKSIISPIDFMKATF